MKWSFKKSKKEVQHHTDYEKLLDNHLQNLQEVLEKAQVTGEPDELHPVFAYLKILTDFLNNQYALRQAGNHSVNSNQMLHNSEKLTQGKYIWTIPDGYYNDPNSRLFLRGSVPFLVFPWNYRRILDNLESQGKEVGNSFDLTKAHVSSNIHNAYIYPLGIVVCTGGNHSQFTYRLKEQNDVVPIGVVYDLSDQLDDLIADEVDKEQIDYVFLFLLKAGKLLLQYPEIFPKIIKDKIEN